MNDNELMCQVDLTRRLGMSLNYTLEGNIKKVNEKLLDKVSDAISRSGSIRLSNPGHAVKVLERLGYTIDYSTVDNKLHKKKNGHVDTTIESDCAGSLSIFLADGIPKNPIKLYFTSEFDISNPDLSIRKSHLIELRKGIWHEIMEMALLAINNIVFNKPETKLVPYCNFADDHVGKYARVRVHTYDSRFFPWSGDKTPPISHPSYLANKTAMSLPQEPIKELTLSADSKIIGYILDHGNRNVMNINVPAGKTFTWGSVTRTNTSQYKYNAASGRYRIKAAFGKYAVNQTVEILPAKPLTLKARFLILQAKR